MNDFVLSPFVTSMANAPMAFAVVVFAPDETDMPEVVRVVIVGAVARTGFPVPVGVEFLISLPVVPSKRAGTASVAELGPTTSPVPATALQVGAVVVPLLVNTCPAEPLARRVGAPEAPP